MIAIIQKEIGVDEFVPNNLFQKREIIFITSLRIFFEGFFFDEIQKSQ